MKRLLLAAALWSSFPAAHAALFNFSYSSPNNGSLSGQVDGALQADGNTVVVDSIIDFPIMNFAAGPSMSYLRSTDAQNFGTPGLTATLTLDGSFMDFYASSAAGDTFTFNAGNLSAATYGAGGMPFYATSGFYSVGIGGGGFSETFNATNWHLAAVPVPATAWLFASAVGALGWRRRCRIADAVPAC